MSVFNALAFESDNEEDLMQSSCTTLEKSSEEILAMLIEKRREKRRLRKAKAKKKSIFAKIRVFLTLFIQGIFCWVFQLWMKPQKKDVEKFEETIKMLKERLEKLESQERSSATSNVQPQPQVSQPPAVSDPNNEVTEKYKKMLSVGVPEMAVRQKMLKDGVDPKLLFPAMETAHVPLQSIKKAIVKAAGSSDSSLSKTPAPRGLNITVSALQDIRGSLRKAGSTRDGFENSENKENPQPFAISAAKIQEIRSNLKKTATKTPMESRYRASPGMRDITNIDSAQKTPYVKKAIQSPSTARSDGEFLHLALLRKFQNVDSPSDARY